MRWVEQYDLPAQLEAGDGFVKIENFLPSGIAEGILEHLQAIPQDEWEAAEDDSGGEDTIPHRFALAELEVSEPCRQPGMLAE